MKKFIPLLALMWAHNSAADRDYGWHKVMGDIEVRTGERAGNIRTVNGDVELEDESEAGSVKTTNGRLRVGDNVKADELSTVNGSIKAGKALFVTGDVQTVNGGIRIDDQSQVGESVMTVNGSISLDGTIVGEDVKTTNGDIELEASVIKGDIVFEEVGYSWNNDSRPTLRIDEDSEVRGTIYLRRKVNLRISDRATTGEIIHEY